MTDSSTLLLEHYRALYRRHGQSYRAVQWSSADAQTRRFDVLCDLIEPEEQVVDLGCGLGELLQHLRNTRGFRGSYLGVDQVPEFIADARHRFADDTHSSFEIGNLYRQADLPQCDCTVMSGVFNNAIEASVDNTKWLTDTITRAFEASTRAVGFNALSSWANRHQPGLFCLDPQWLSGWCAEHLTQRLVLRHDYNSRENLDIPLDFTIYLFK